MAVVESSKDTCGHTRLPGCTAVWSGVEIQNELHLLHSLVKINDSRDLSRSAPRLTINREQLDDYSWQPAFLHQQSHKPLNKRSERNKIWKRLQEEISESETRDIKKCFVPFPPSGWLQHCRRCNSFKYHVWVVKYFYIPFENYFSSRSARRTQKLQRQARKSLRHHKTVARCGKFRLQKKEFLSLDIELFFFRVSEKGSGAWFNDFSVPSLRAENVKIFIEFSGWEIGCRKFV